MQNMQNMQNINRKDQCTKSGTWMSVFTSWKVWTTLLPHPNRPFSALSTAPGFCLLRGCTSGDGLHWQLTHKTQLILCQQQPLRVQSSFCQAWNESPSIKTDWVWRGSKEDRVCLSSARILRCLSNVRPRALAPCIAGCYSGESRCRRLRGAMHSPSGHRDAAGPLNGSGALLRASSVRAAGDFGNYFSSLLHRHLQVYWNLSILFPDIMYLQFVHDFVSMVSSISGFP
jgi:hypothetical protein